MNQLIQLKTITLPLPIAFALACCALLPRAQAVSPPPDGGYDGGNTAEGTDALYSLNTFGKASLGHIEALSNTALGYHTLYFNTSGDRNTATGDSALFQNNSSDNTANGYKALSSNAAGSANTATGSRALDSNTTGSANTATGYQALFHNTADGNTADGYQALYSNTGGIENTAVGYRALFSINGLGFLAGSANTAVGWSALANNVTGVFNTAIGAEALQHNAVGGIFAAPNTAIGARALRDNTGGGNTAIGVDALVGSTGNGNIAIGGFSGNVVSPGDYNIYINSTGVDYESHTIRIGRTNEFGSGQTATYIVGISGATASAGAAVYVNSDGKLGTSTSSKRFKENIQPMDKASEAILALRPVSFRYKKEIDAKAIPQFGLVAEEVEKVNPDLVVRDKEGKPYTVRYDQVNAMLLNEFLKEHHTVQELKTTVVQQQKQIEALTAGLQKVSAQLELNKSAPQTVLNNQ
jgi:hypothetical protein